MQVLVWKGYGEIDVYDISTPEKFKSVISEIIACLDNWGLERQIELVQKHLEKHPENLMEIRRAFNTLRDGINPAYDNDNFEALFITDLK